MKRYRIISILILVIVIILPSMVFGESLTEGISYESEIKYGPFSSGYIESDIYYENYSLDSAEIVYNYEELKAEIHRNMKDYAGSFSIQYEGDTSTIKADIDNMWNEIFEEDEYLYGSVSTYGAYSYSGYENNVLIDFKSFTYHTTKIQEDFVDSEVKKVVEDIIIPQMNDFEKVKSINDWVVLNAEYSQDTNSSPHAAYALFDEGKGVCQAYALAAYRLLEEAGIQVRYVTGKGGSSAGNLIAHSWNQVKVDGKWYNLDTTWNDPTPNNPGQVSYGYFLMSDESLEKDHFKDDSRTYEVAADDSYEYMNEMSHAATLDDYIYYSSKDDDIKLYKNEIGTKEKSKVIDIRAQYITGYGDWIYYSNYSDGGYLYKVRKDGRENIRLNEVASINIYIDLPYLYYDNMNVTEKIEIGEHINPEDGYEILALNENQSDPKYMWKVKLNQPLEPETVNFNSVYVENGYGEKLEENDFSIEISENDPSIVNINIISRSGYTKDIKYYVVVDTNLKSLEGKSLSSPIKMPFIIR